VQEHAELVTLEQLLVDHDWTYNYSDDYRYWTKGVTESERIQVQLDVCRVAGHGARAKQLYDQYNPFIETDQEPTS
jgi:hypothetical protein